MQHNSGKTKAAGKGKIMKGESSEDIGRQEIEEGKSSVVGDFLSKSPNIQKKAMDFGHGTSNEYMWLYTSKAQKQGN
jgi:hypothetical protein